MKNNTKSLDRKTIGRRRDESDEDYYYFSNEDPFWIDQNCKIALSKAYRRLEGKTQVFYSPESPHTRTRMTHTTEVKVLASSIARSLNLDQNLAEAIALGHDIGHVPFGHLGESFLTEKLGQSFRHNAFAVIVAELIERRGRGLNLCYETLEGIYRHSGDLDNFDYSYPEEYFAVRIADKVAYIFSDYNDAERMNYVTEIDKPNPIEKLGRNQRERVKNVLEGVYRESKKEGVLSFSKTQIAKLFFEAYRWMYENVYAKADKRIDFSVLEKGYNFIKTAKFFDKHNPVIVFGLMTEKEIKYLAKLYDRNEFDREKIKKIGILEVLSGIKDVPVDNFSSFCFNREEFIN